MQIAKQSGANVASTDLNALCKWINCSNVELFNEKKVNEKLKVKYYFPLSNTIVTCYITRPCQ
jgi:hypothetical protein